VGPVSGRAVVELTCRRRGRPRVHVRCLASRLALVADDVGQQVAPPVAREFVVYLRRAGGQAQFSAPLAAQVAEREPLGEFLDWIVSATRAGTTPPSATRIVSGWSSRWYVSNWTASPARQTFQSRRSRAMPWVMSRSEQWGRPRRVPIQYVNSPRNVLSAS